MPQAPAAGGPKKKIAVLRAEVAIAALFVLLGTSAWVFIEGKLTTLLKRSEPREEQLQLAQELPWRQDSLAMTEAEQKATEEQLIQARLEFYKRGAALEAFDAVPRPSAPKVTERAAGVAEQPGAAKGDDKTAPPQTREDLLLSREAAARSVDALRAQLDRLQGAANELRAQVEERKWRAAVEFGESHFLYSLKKLAYTFALTAALLLLIYLVLLIPLGLFEKRASASGYETNRGLMLKMAGGLTLVLIAYQTFQVAGAAFVGVLVLLLFLYGMPWPERRAARK